MFFYNSNELPSGTYLNGGRYLVSQGIGNDGFSIKYVGTDAALNKNVIIREAFYNNLFYRNTEETGNPAPLAVAYGYEVSINDIMRKTISECMSLSEDNSLNNIAKVYDWFTENNTAYVVSEAVDGVTMYERIRQYGTYTWGTLYQKISPLLNSISKLHNKGVFHRNINPQNIMIKNVNEKDEEFVLTNFDPSRPLESEMLAAIGGTLSSYAPYEQVYLTRQDSASTDIYELAATIYYAITAENPSTEMYDTVEGNFPKIDVLKVRYNIPENVVNALKSALSPDVDSRCRTIVEFMGMLSGSSEKTPHYLYGRPKKIVNDPNFLNSADNPRKGMSKQQIKTEYYTKLAEKQKEEEKQQWEINSTVSELQPKYARRKASYDRSIISMKGLIIPAVFVVIIVVIIFLSNS